MRTMSKSAKKFFAAAACISMLLVCFAGCNQLNGGGEKKKPTEQQKSADQQKPNNQQKPADQQTPNTPNNPADPQKSSEKQLLEFKFEQKNNDTLTTDVLGKVDEKKKTVTVEVLPGTDKTKLKASFQISDKAKLFIGTIEQKSGETVNDFSNITEGIKLTVKAEDGTTQEYTVKVYGEVGEKIRLQTFSFKKEHNMSVLSQDVDAFVTYIDKGTRGVAIIKLPIGTTQEALKTLKPSFTVNSANVKLFVNGTELTSGVTPVDFSDIVQGTKTLQSLGAVIEARANDGGSRLYTAVVEVDLEPAPKAEVEKYFGSYYAEAETQAFGKAKIVIILEEKKVTMYSTGMSMDYVNVEWEKKPDNTYTCTTYNKNKPQIKGRYGKGSYDFIEEGGDTFVITNIMGANVKAKKGNAFVFDPSNNPDKYKDIPPYMHL